MVIKTLKDDNKAFAQIYNDIKKNAFNNKWIEKEYHTDKCIYLVCLCDFSQQLIALNQETTEIYHVRCIERQTLNNIEEFSCSYICLLGITKDLFVMRTKYKDYMHTFLNTADYCEQRWLVTNYYVEQFAKGKTKFKGCKDSKCDYVKLFPHGKNLFSIRVMPESTRIFDEDGADCLVKNYTCDIMVRTPEVEFRLWRPEEILQLESVVPDLVNTYLALKKDIKYLTREQKRLLKDILAPKEYSVRIKPIYKDDEITISVKKSSVPIFYNDVMGRLMLEEEILDVSTDKRDDDLKAYMSNLTNINLSYNYCEKKTNIYTKFTIDDRIVAFTTKDKESIETFIKTKYGFIHCRNYSYKQRGEFEKVVKNYFSTLSRLTGKTRRELHEKV